ncbi:MAG: polysaccharide biosynthesis tyrosine autokinase [Chloroflexi bacterium]|nr:polysaccharide biosynthesis tyrosine autokinase [Chloroflexota bacterium]
MELLEYWKIIRKRLWLILLLMAVSTASATYYSLQQVPMYRTTTTLFLNPAYPSPLLPYYVALSAKSLANTYAEFMRTRSFAQLVAQEMGDGTTLEEVLGAISTRYVEDTQFLKISITHANPEKAQKLADTATQVFIAENISRQQAQQEQIRTQDNVKALQRQQLQELQQSLQDELEHYAQRIEVLQAQIAELESKPSSQEADQRILALRQELISNQSLRVGVLTSLAQTQASLAASEGGSSVDTAVVVDAAPLPTEPLPQQTLQHILLALAASLGLGVGLAFLLEYLDYTVKTPEELDAVYGMTTLGVIGVIEGEGKGREGGTREEIVTLTAPRSPAAEAFRALRTNIQFANPGQAVRSLLVTSAGPFEGKTLTAANLAVSLAQDGSRVILADTDLRKPRLHRVFDIPKEPGFTDLIVDQKDAFEDYLRPTSVQNLRVLPCGKVPPNPAELLGSSRAAEVMEQLKEHADVVVYDSPPAATVTDAVVMACRVDGVLQVVWAGGTRRDLVRQGQAVLEKVGARILGAVLNRVNLSDLGYYSYYYYYGYYYRDHHEHESRERSLLRRLLPWRRRRRGKRRKSERDSETAAADNSAN